MKAIKQLVTYLIWTLIALLLGVSHMFIMLGPRETGTSFIKIIGLIFYDYALLHIGAYVGAVIALVFILVDSIYLKKKLKCHKKPMFIRLVVLLLIAVTIGTLHYVLEKGIDVI